MFGLGSSTQQNDGVIEDSTPWTAASDGRLDLLQRSLTKLGLPPTAADQNGYTILHAAAAYWQQPILEWLLQQDGIDVNVKDNDGDTPLHHVDQVEAARFLLEVAKVNPNVTNNEGKTALQSKEEDLAIQENDEDEDEDETERLKEVVAYLQSII